MTSRRIFALACVVLNTAFSCPHTFGQAETSTSSRFELRKITPASNSHQGGSQGSLAILTMAAGKDHERAEQILKKSIEQNKAVGNTNAAAHSTYLLAFIFIAQDRFKEAEHWSNELLTSLDKPNSMCPSEGASGAQMMFRLIQSFIEKKKYDIAETLTNATEKILRAQLGPRNELFINVFQLRAKLLIGHQKFEEAEKFARKALETEIWNGCYRPKEEMSASLLKSTLQLEGKKAEADDVEIEPKHQKVFFQASKVYARSPSSETGAEFYVNSADDTLKNALRDAVADRGEGSKDAATIADRLTRLYMTCAQTAEAETLQTNQLKILDSKWGNCSKPKAQCYLYLSEIYLAENRESEALKYAQLISDPEVFNIDTVDAQVRRANALLKAAGDKSKVLEIAKSAAKVLSSETDRVHSPTFYKSMKDCIQIFTELGDEFDSRELQQHLNELKQLRYQL